MTRKGGYNVSSIDDNVMPKAATRAEAEIAEMLRFYLAAVARRERAGGTCEVRRFLPLRSLAARRTHRRHRARS
jgi:hypothetical protein